MIHDRRIPNSSRRSGGCEARRTLRAAPLARDFRPVRAGLCEGGTFKPLDRVAAARMADAKMPDAQSGYEGRLYWWRWALPWTGTNDQFEAD